MEFWLVWGEQTWHAYSSLDRTLMAQIGTDRAPLKAGDLWIPDSGSTYHTTGDSRMMYNMQNVPPEDSRIAFGDGRVLNVLGMGSLDLVPHAQTDFPIILERVLLVEGMHISLFLCMQDRRVRRLRSIQQACTCLTLH